MSSQRVQVSSGDDFSDHADPRKRKTNDYLLHPNWNGINREIKSKAKSTCGKQSKKDSEADQILFYKQKAHQSFMQVSQVQQLHEEEIEQLKQQYEQKIRSLQGQLKQKNETIQVYQKNTNHHMLELQKTLQMEGLELIECKETNLTRFDQSTILSFKEFLSEKQGDAKIQSMRASISAFISTEVSKWMSNPQQLTRTLMKQISGIFEYLKEIRQQLLTKVDSHEALLKRYEQIDANHKKLKSRFEAIQKDATLMSQNLRKLKEDKFDLESKLGETQRKLNEMQRQIKMAQGSKEALLKISLRETNPTLTASRNLLGTQKSIIKNNPNQLKTYKSYRQIDKSRSRSHYEDGQNENNDAFLQASKQKSSSKNEESFNMQDLIAQMNDDSRDDYLRVSVKDKKPVLLSTSSQLGSKIRKKSFDY